MIVDIDKECEKLVEAMNLIPGITTIESCCGHGQSPYHIWFTADSLESLPRLLYWFDGCHSGFYNWRVLVTTDCAMSPVHFYIEGPMGKYDEAKEIAELLTTESQSN